MDHVMAVDIGGTKMAVGVVAEDGTVVASAQVPTAGDNGEALFGSLTSLADQVRSHADVALLGCGVGCGGPMSAGGVTVTPINIPAWVAFPLRDRLSQHLGLPTWVDNDAKALALGEGWLGAARGERDYLAMVVSTGVGGGLVVDGRLLDGASGNAGHIGHVIVEPDGHRCGCGAIGCLEAEASGTAIARITGRPAAEADETRRRLTGTLVGRAVASVAHLLDIRTVCIAGSVALGYGQVFFDAAQAELEARAQLDFAHGVRIIPAGLGADGPLIGAAAVGWRALGRSVGVA